MIPRYVAVVIGIWLMAAPALLDYGDPAAANDRIFGPVAGGLAFVALWEVVRPLRWGTLPVGLWFVIAPLALWYSDVAAIVSSVVCGLALAATAPYGGVDAERYGGGWSVLWQKEPLTTDR